MSDLKTLALKRKLLPRIACSLLSIFFFVVLTAKGINLGGIYLITWFTASLADVCNWRHAYIAVIVMILYAFIARELTVERPLLSLGQFKKKDSLIKNKKNGNIKIGNVAVA